jgi:hypothetical protein
MSYFSETSPTRIYTHKNWRFAVHFYPVVQENSWRAPCGKVAAPRTIAAGSRKFATGVEDTYLFQLRTLFGKKKSICMGVKKGVGFEIYGKRPQKRPN